ncbi:unnamed protein product [Meloidogyne enterolobii]|uniref:Uncharacterized protein n=1 Tax=Meloidogyne enterolobii TaxID=390850 RepID=A0ACB1A0B7_MELEN
MFVAQVVGIAAKMVARTANVQIAIAPKIVEQLVVPINNLAVLSREGALIYS